MNITIVGLGVIGGSMAKAIRENIRPENLWAVDVDFNILKEAYEDGIIDDIDSEVKIYLESSDMVILCTYPKAAVDFIVSNMDNFKKNAIITDTSGIKSKIVEEVRKVLRQDLEFIGGHPMAGKESSGYKYSDGSIFRGASCIITPDEYCSSENVLLLKELLFKIGFMKVVELTPLSHDKIVAYTSQLPHVIACAVISSKSYEEGKECIGGSFRDMTRVADINCHLWSELLIENKENILTEISSLVEGLKNIHAIIENNDRYKLEELLKKSSIIRREMNYEGN